MAFFASTNISLCKCAVTEMISNLSHIKRACMILFIKQVFPRLKSPVFPVSDL